MKVIATILLIIWEKTGEICMKKMVDYFMVRLIICVFFISFAA